MGETVFLTLNQLFDSIGVIEKGIEKIYHYLLLNKRIDNLKDVCADFNLTLKRGYKISSVLSELELVQTYDRPMKIILEQPVIPVWQRIISKRIEELKNIFEEKKTYAEDTFEKFIKMYDLKEEEVAQEPVEFINYTIENIDSLYYPFLASEECRLAIGIRYDNILVSNIRDQPIDTIQKQYKPMIQNGINNISENLKTLNLQIIFNHELIEILLTSREFQILTTMLKTLNLEFNTIDVRVSKEEFSNFSLVDDELIQPSFDPSNMLIGAYISRNTNIYQIFFDKFNDLFSESIPINDFLENQEKINIRNLTDLQNFVLCLL